MARFARALGAHLRGERPMSESTASVRFHIPKTAEATVIDPNTGRRFKRPFPMKELIETIADSYPPFSGSPKNARRGARLIAAFAEQPEDGTGVAEVEASSAEDLKKWLDHPTYQSGRETVDRSPLTPSAERASLDYFESLENPLPKKTKAEPADEPEPGAGGNGTPTPKTKRARVSAPAAE